ncbi:hypothetical protein J4439_02630 [Candidatus Woesearchaeota archaeon]|nr:hypothetical protein [Candidatus Woesearchaeota archaeon]
MTTHETPETAGGEPGILGGEAPEQPETSPQPPENAGQSEVSGPETGKSENEVPEGPAQGEVPGPEAGNQEATPVEQSAAAPAETLPADSEERKKLLLERFETIKREIAVMRTKLNEIDKLKEGVFSKRDGVSSDIGEKIRRIKELKRERDDFTRQVREKKEERSRLNTEVRAKIDRAKELRGQQDTAPRPHARDMHKSPDQLLKLIEKMELRIETEAMPFEQERKLMGQIKLRKKEYDEVKVAGGMMDEVRTLSKDITVLKKQSDDVHQQIQELATKSQERHEEMLTLSKEIDTIKEGEQGVFDEFSKLKEQYAEQNAKLRAKLDEMNKVKQDIAAIDSALRQKKNEELQAEMKEREEAVEDKIKRGKKLTTEDLLIFQKSGS